MSPEWVFINTYNIPMPKSAHNPIFFLTFNFRFQIIVMGSKARQVSMKTFQPVLGISLSLGSTAFEH